MKGLDEIDGRNEGTNSQNNRPARESQFPPPTAAPDGRRLPRFAARQWNALPVLAQVAAQQQLTRHRGPAPLPAPATFSPEDEQFLDDLEHNIFLYFWEQANPQTGLDQGPLQRAHKDTSVVASIASTGFGLTAICIAEKRGFISHQDARLRVLATLISLEEAADASRILLSLCQYQHGRKNMGLRSLFRRYRNVALRHSYLPPALSRSRHHRTRPCNF